MRKTFLALWVALLFVPALASAQEDDDARARRHFASGESYYEEGAYEDAVREFTQAYRLSHRPALLFNLYTAEERFGRLSDAATHLEQYLREMPPDLENRGALEARLANLRARITESAQPTETATTTQVTEPTTQPVEPTTVPTPSEPHPAPASSSGGDLMLGGGIALGVGAAGFVTFAIAGLAAQDAYNQLNAECGSERLCTPDDLATMNSNALIADIGLGIGIAGVGTGVVLMVLGATSGNASTDSVAVLPMVSPTFAGLSMQGGF